jgi:hypothetical protein
MEFCSNQRRKFELDSIFLLNFFDDQFISHCLMNLPKYLNLHKKNPLDIDYLSMMTDEYLSSTSPFTIVSSFKIIDIVCLGTSGDLFAIAAENVAKIISSNDPIYHSLFGDFKMFDDFNEKEEFIFHIPFPRCSELV